MIKSAKQLIISQNNIIKNYCLSKGKILRAKLIDFGNDRVRYHGGDLEGTFIVQLFQNSDKILKEFSIGIHKIITNNLKKRIHWKIYRNMYSIWFFIFLVKDLIWEMSKGIIDKFEIVIKKYTVMLDKSTTTYQTVKMHGIEDRVLNEIIRYNVIGFFIEHAHQFGMNDVIRKANMKDRVNSSINYFKMESG